MTDVAQRPARPVPGPSRPYKFPTFERSALANGIRLVVAPVKKIPLVTVLAISEAGALADPAGRAGAAPLTARLLLEGTRDLDGTELTRRFERLGASIEAYADWDVAVLTMTVQASHLEPAFRLFADALRSPAFDPREVERLKAERLADLLQLRSEPRGLADEHFISKVYAASSRYAVAEGGNPGSVNAITREDVARFHAARFAPGSTTLVWAGHVDPARAASLANESLGDWVGAGATAAHAADGPSGEPPLLYIVPKGDAPQSEIRVGHVGVPRKHADYFPLVVMNSVLGGLFNSRINMNLREVHGYTYGAFSAFDWRRQAGPFFVSTAVRTDATVAALREILTEIDRIREERISDDELSLATSYLDGVFPIRYETTAAIAGALANLCIFGLPDDYFDTYRANITGVSSAAVLAAAQTHLHPKAMQIVVVGDPTVVSADAEKQAMASKVVEAAVE